MQGNNAGLSVIMKFSFSHLLPVWADAACGCARWNTDTECSLPQPSVRPGRIAAMLSSPSGWKTEGQCHSHGEQSQRRWERMAERPGSQLKSLATCHRREPPNYQKWSECRNRGSPHEMGISAAAASSPPCAVERVHFDIRLGASTNYFCSRQPSACETMFSYWWFLSQLTTFTIFRAQR